MKFVCDRCQTKYSIADERVRGKVLKVKCKTCANLITVREARPPSSGGLPTLSAGAAAARPRTGANPALSVPTETPGIDSERTQLAMSPFGAEPDPFADLGALAPAAGGLAPAAPLAPARRPTGQLAVVDDGVQWYMALAGNRTGPFNRHQLVDRLAPLAKNADVHIWNERLDGWKAPTDVAEIAGELSRRRSAPPPPPLPGAPRRPTPPPIPPLGGLTGSAPAHAQPARRPTGPHAPPSPAGHDAGGASKLPPPGGVHPALAARGAHGADASSLLETPAPLPHHAPHGAKTNGVGGAGHAPPRSQSSDVLQMLNMPGAAQNIPGAPPRLMSITSAIGTQQIAVPSPRSRSSLMILALLGVIAAIVVVAVISLKKTPKPAPPIARPTPPAPVETVVAKPVEPPPPPVEPVVEKPVEPPPGKTGKKGKQTRLVVAKGQTATTSTGTAVTPTGAGGGDAARFSDNRKMNISGGTSAVRPPPAQADITRVITNNQGGIKVCYQRALTRDNTLTRGKLAVKLSIGISGRVKHVGLEGPTQFRLLLEPCIKEVVQRWVFPQASEEYGTEFPLVFSGNE